MEALTKLAISNDNFAFDPTTGFSFSINRVAKELIDLLIKGSTEDELIEYLGKEYQLTSDQAYVDIMDFFAKLNAFNLMDPK